MQNSTDLLLEKEMATHMSESCAAAAYMESTLTSHNEALPKY